MKEIVITSNESGQRFDKFLRKYLKDMSLSAIYKSIRTKNVLVNGKKSSEKYILNEGDVVKFKLDVEDEKTKKNMDFLEIEYDFDITYEDHDILVVQKAPGKLVHPDEGKEITLTDEVKSYLYDKGQYDPAKEITFSPSPCNRLDRNTQGLIIFAKNYETLKGINEAIRNGWIKKYYTTLVKGKLDDGLYTAYIVKDEAKNRVKIYSENVRGSKEIITDITTVDTIGQFSLLDVDLITGRSHQIRAHLASMKNPILGDPKYGDGKINKFFKHEYGIDHQMLIAYKLVFKKCPESIKQLEGKTFTMPLPAIFKKLRNDIFKI